MDFTQHFKLWWQSIDRTLLVLLLVLMAVGVLLVFAASPAVAQRINLEKNYFVIRHAVLLIPALLIMFALANLNARLVRLLCLIGLPIMLGLTIATLFVGAEVKGATRWFPLFGFTLQPSEFLKPLFVVVAAWLLAKQVELQHFPGWTIAILLYGLIACVLVLQPDFGMTLVLGAVFFGQLFVAGLSLGLVAGGAVLGVVGIGGAYMFLPHVTERIDKFLNPESGDTFQVQRANEAFLNGGWFGTGPGEGTVKFSIPDAHADFIFAVAGEEWGLIFCAALVILLFAIIGRGLWRGLQQKDLFSVLAVSGLMLQFALQTLVNLGSTLHLIPTKGMTLPFISYGGTSLLAMAVGMGIVLALTKRDTPYS